LQEEPALIHAALVANVSYPRSNWITIVQELAAENEGNLIKLEVVSCGLHPVPEPSVLEISVGIPLIEAEITSLKVALFSPQLSRLIIKWLNVLAFAFAFVIV